MTDTQSDIEALTRLNADYLASGQHMDVQRYQEILAEDFTVSLPDLLLRDKKQFIDMIAVGRPFTDLKADDGRKPGSGGSIMTDAIRTSLEPIATQIDLLGTLDPAVDTDFTTARRIALDETSWIEHVPGWLRGGDHLFKELLETAPWEQRDRWMFARRFVEPRLTAEYRDLAEAPQSLLHTVATALSEHYGVDYRTLWMNLYRTNRDSTGWHGDLIGKVQQTSTVPVLSLGVTRRFLIRPVAGGKSLSLKVGGGDLVVMGGRSQRDWRHSVPKQATPAGARISVNFAPFRA
jgi:alkylated DNA repair dioxygenase AlkB